MLKAFRLSAGRSPKAGRNGRHCGRGLVGRAVYSVVADSDVLPAPRNASAGIRCHVTQVGVLLTDGGIELAFGKLTYPELCYNVLYMCYTCVIHVPNSGLTLYSISSRYVDRRNVLSTLFDKTWTLSVIKWRLCCRSNKPDNRPTQSCIRRPTFE